MSESMDDVRYDIASTRQRMSDTLAELDSRLSERKAAVTERVDAVKTTIDPARLGSQVAELIQEHPMAAVAVALGLGVFLGASGADRAIVAGATAAVQKGSHATVDAARSAGSAVMSRVHGQEESDAAPRPMSDMQVPLESGYIADDVEPGLVDRVASALRFEELEQDMRAAFTSQKLPTSI